ncbi:PREDICTED: putative F-box protein At1g31090 [Camelina sativa]|uniref:F-box protein At1g31090 n=1 Tax=Camelina sativa TaxID=90675 RepID=A0ABM0VYE6_CAMSA|nr:PREDICTED: putative F-box protein At1g31090 [Camelina sativa]
MNREETSNSIHNDLILEILSRLPTKSIGRFRCVSKLWRSMLHKPYFTKLFLTRSSARPRLLIGVIQDHEWSFFSAPQPQNHYGKSSLVVAADFHMKSSIDLSFVMCRYVSGLLYFPTMLISNMDKDEAGVICNPTTRQFAILPQLRLGPVKDYGLVTCKHRGGLIGFDPIGGKFKVFSINNIVDSKMVRYILTLGSENERWRKIECPFNEDDNGGRSNDVCISGILVKETAFKPFYVFYFNPERNHLLSVEIQGLGEDHDWSKYHAVCAFVDHVEDLQFNVMKSTSLNPLEQNHRPMSTSTLFREDLQVTTVAQLGQDRRTFESINTDSFQK